MDIARQPAGQARARSKKGGLTTTLIGLVILILGLWQYREAQLIAAAGRNAAQAAARLAVGLESFVEARTDEMGLLADLVRSERVDDLGFEGIAATIPASQQLYRWIAWLDRTGMVLACTDAGRVGTNLRGSQWFPKLLQSRSAGRAWLDDAGPGEVAGLVNLAAVYNADGQVQGGIVGLIPLSVVEQLLERMEQRWPTGWKNVPVEYQLMAPDGDLLVDSSLHQGGLVNLRRLELPSALAAASSRPGYVEEVHLRRHLPVVTGYARMHEHPHWTVLLRFERDRLVGPLREQMWRYGGAAAVLLLVGWGVVGAWVTVRKRVLTRRPSPQSAALVSGGDLHRLSVHEPVHQSAPEPTSVTQTDGEAVSRAQSIGSRMSRAIERLSLGGGINPDRWLHEAVESLREATDASRMTLLEKFENSGPDRVSQLVRVYSSADATSNGDEGERPGAERFVERWRARLARGEIIALQVADLPEVDRATLLAQQVTSVLWLPLFQRLEWWGVLQLEQCQRPREWTSVEVTALHDAGRLLGAAMELQKRQQGLQTALYMLERTFDSPRDGIVLVDATGRVVSYNRQFIEMWNIPETVVAARDGQQTLAHVLSQVKAPEQFLRAVGEFNAAPESEGYDLLELVDGRLFERVTEPQPVGWDGNARMWRFNDITAAKAPSGRPSQLRHEQVSSMTDRRAPIAVTEERDAAESARLRALSLRLEQAREDERKRLARELHDQLGQALTGLKLDLSWLSGKLTKDYEALQGKAQAISEMVSATIQTVRRLSTELRPPILDDLGLAAAVEWQTTEFGTRSGVATTVRISSEIERSPLDQARATAVFRILQEILTNVARHAGATTVHVSLSTENGEMGDRRERWVVLSVRDNGRGISPAEMNDPRSIGLAGMRERAMMLSGMLKVEAMPEAGTIVTVHIPMERDHD